MTPLPQVDDPKNTCGDDTAARTEAQPALASDVACRMGHRRRCAWLIVRAKVR